MNLSWHRDSFAGLLGVVLIVTVTSVVFPFLADRHFLSPDETSNAAFARTFAMTSALWLPDPLPGAAAGTVHPRSMTTRADGRIVSVSFVMFPALLGLGGKLLGAATIPFWPLAAFALSVLAVWRIASWYIGEGAARVATVLYSFHPVVAFYASRTLWHNGTLVFFLLIGWAALIEGIRRRSYVWLGVGALLYSLAIAVRPSEVVWELVLAAGIVVSLRPRPRRSWILLTVVPAVALAGLLWLQAATYGSLLSFGYASQPADTTSAAAAAASFFERARLLVFPFGVHVGQSLALAGTFVARFVAIPTLLGLLGLVVALRRGGPNRFRAIALAVLVTIVWLTLFYGSFEFTETFTRSQIGLGSSYLRYWLPGLVLLTLFAPLGLRWLKERGVFGPTGGRVLVAVALVLSVQSWLVDPAFGLVKAVRRDLRDLGAARAETVAIVPPDAVIAAGTLDKAFYPERQVIGYSTLSRRLTEQFADLLDQGVGLYFTSADADDIRRVGRTLAGRGYALLYLRTLTGGARLYRFVQAGEDV